MAKSSYRLQTLLIAPLVLLAVVLFEDLVALEVRRHVADVHLRTALIVALYGVAFAIIVETVSPWLKAALVRVRRGSRRGAGALGVWLFYAAAYGMVYYAFLIAETKGTAALLPAMIP